MGFSYPVLSKEDAEKERNSSFLLNPGVYKFVVTESKEMLSKTGNPMIQLKLSIFADGQETNVYDYLVATKGMSWKIRQFCESVGLIDIYDRGMFDGGYCFQKMGFVDLDLQPEKPKNDGTGGMYKAKNIVVNYVSHDDNKDLLKDKSNPLTASSFVDCELPF